MPTRNRCASRPSSIWQYLSSTPLAAAAADLEEHDPASLERDVVTQWEKFPNEDALILELDVVTATARKN